MPPGANRAAAPLRQADPSATWGVAPGVLGAMGFVAIYGGAANTDILRRDRIRPPIIRTRPPFSRCIRVSQRRRKTQTRPVRAYAGRRTRTHLSWAVGQPGYVSFLWRSARGSSGRILHPAITLGGYKLFRAFFTPAIPVFPGVYAQPQTNIHPKKHTTPILPK